MVNSCCENITAIKQILRIFEAVTMSMNMSYAVARFVNVSTPNHSPVLRRRLHMRYSWIF